MGRWEGPEQHSRRLVVKEEAHWECSHAPSLVESCLPSLPGVRQTPYPRALCCLLQASIFFTVASGTADPSSSVSTTLTSLQSLEPVFCDEEPLDLGVETGL